MKWAEIMWMALFAFCAAVITWLAIKFSPGTELSVPILVACLTSLAWVVGRRLGDIFRD